MCSIAAGARWDCGELAGDGGGEDGDIRSGEREGSSVERDTEPRRLQLRLHPHLVGEPCARARRSRSSSGTRSVTRQHHLVSGAIQCEVAAGHARGWQRTKPALPHAHIQNDGTLVDRSRRPVNEYASEREQHRRRFNDKRRRRGRRSQRPRIRRLGCAHRRSGPEYRD